MRKEEINKEIPLGINKKVIIKLWKVDKTENFPDRLEFACQFLYEKEDIWLQIVRIDNQLHQGKPGTHIHRATRDEVEWTTISFKEAKDRVIEIGENILRGIKW